MHSFPRFVVFFEEALVLSSSAAGDPLPGTGTDVKTDGTGTDGKTSMPTPPCDDKCLPDPGSQDCMECVMAYCGASCQNGPESPDCKDCKCPTFCSATGGIVPNCLTGCLAGKGLLLSVRTAAIHLCWSR